MQKGVIIWLTFHAWIINQKLKNSLINFYLIWLRFANDVYHRQEHKLIRNASNTFHQRVVSSYFWPFEGVYILLFFYHSSLGYIFDIVWCEKYSIVVFFMSNWVWKWFLDKLLIKKLVRRCCWTKPQIFFQILESFRISFCCK